MPSNLDRQLDRVADECVVVRARLISRVLTSIHEEELRPFGLKPSQMNVLVATHKLGRPRPADVGRALRIETSTLSRNLERMRAKGWIAAAEEGRGAPFELTPAGKKLLASVLPAWERAQARARRVLGERDASALSRIADRIWANG